MDLLPQFLTQLAGGGGAEYLDRAKPNWTQYPLKSATGPGPGITPGAMAALGMAALLAVMPGKASGAGAPMWKVVAANLTTGALLWESGKLVSSEVIPKVQQALNPNAGVPAGALGAGAPMPFMAAPGVYGMPAHYYGPQVSDSELQQSLAQIRAGFQAH